MNRYGALIVSTLALALSQPVLAHDHDKDNGHGRHHHHGHHHSQKERVYYEYKVVQPVVQERVITTYRAPARTTTVVTTSRPIAQGGDEWLNYRISNREAVVLQTYYRPVTVVTVPVHTYRYKEVPGWREKVRRGYRLDPVVYSYARPVPVEVVRQLPQQPDGTVLVELDGKIVRLANATKTIVDVLEL